MRIRVLGSFGSRIPGYRTTSLLVDDGMLLDAGTVTSTLTLEEQILINDILLTHAHLDHMVDLAFLIDNVFTFREEPLRVWAPEQVLETLRSHLFNGEVWPDFTRLPSSDFPVLSFLPLEPDVKTEIAGYEVRWERVNHPVFTAGYCLTKGGKTVLFSGDTAATDRIWELARSYDDLKMAFVETSFPNRLEKLAAASGHLTPSMLGEELAKFGRPGVPVKIFHMKPQFLAEIEEELNVLGNDCLQILRGGEDFNF